MNDPSSFHEAFVQIGVTTRSGREESVHYGAVVGLGMDGSIEFSLGDPRVVIFPRSSTKPIQATAMVASGLALPPRLLALVCASHDGSPLHVAAAREILATAGLADDDLGNTADYPLNDSAAAEVIRNGGHRSKIQMNCSGKHSGMLTTCVSNGWPHDCSYLNDDHPLQHRITHMVSELCGEEPAHIGIDGCGAPAHAVSLVGVARALRNVAMSDQRSAAGQVALAMRGHPEMVGGPTRDVTLLMQGVDGLVAKDGAEGVFAAALGDGRAIALKIADGTDRARSPLMKIALQALGVDVSRVDPRAFESPVLGHGKPVGSVRITASI